MTGEPARQPSQLCKEHAIATYIADPDGGLTAFQPAVELALQRIHDRRLSTSRFSATTSSAPSDTLPSDPGWAAGSLHVDERECLVDARAEQLWSVLKHPSTPMAGTPGAWDGGPVA